MIQLAEMGVSANHIARGIVLHVRRGCRLTRGPHPFQNSVGKHTTTFIIPVFSKLFFNEIENYSFSGVEAGSSHHNSIMRRAPTYRIEFQNLVKSLTITCLALRAACRNLSLPR
jgi:hypothetical protein